MQTMQQTCPNCGHINRAGIVFCENCGTSLIGSSPLSTKALPGATVPLPEADAPPASQALGTGILNAAAAPVESAISSVGSDTFKEGWLLRIEVDGSNEPTLLTPKQELILGRRDPATGAMPDIDLTPFAGYRMGVSRRHSAIRSADGTRLDLWDLGSSNGTFLNGMRLVAYRPYRMRDGDEIRLGQMSMKAFFQPPKTEVKPEVKPDPKPEVKTEVKPDPKPEVKTEVKPDPKTEAKTEVKPDPKPEVKTEVKPDSKVESASASPSEPKPDA